ncbi:MAG: hypothetical protein ACK5XX_00645, partial [Holosporales bacterium]
IKKKYHSGFKTIQGRTSMPQLFLNQTANANSTAFDWHGGQGTFYVAGTFAGAVVKLQASFDLGSNWIDIPDASFTAPSAVNFNLGKAQLRANIASVTGTTSVTAGY